MHRDSYASHIGHEDMLYFASVAENESVERIRYTMLEVGNGTSEVKFLEDASTLWSSSCENNHAIVIFCLFERLHDFHKSWSVSLNLDD